MSVLELLRRSDYMIFFLLALTQNSQNLEKSAFNPNPKADEARREPKKLLTNIFALCLLHFFIFTSTVHLPSPIF